MKFLQEELTFSERRACRAIEIDRKTIRYKPVVKDSPGLISRVRAIAEKYPSFGYRRIHVRLQKDGIKINLKRLRRIYHEQGLFLRRKKKNRRQKFIGERKPSRVLSAPNQLWCIDFMFDRTQRGSKLAILTIIDQHTRLSPGIFVRSSFRQRDLRYALEAAIYAHGKPAGILSDNGIEFTHQIHRDWAKKHGIDLFYIRPGNPIENAFNESFNGRVRDECLNRNAFDNLEEAEEGLESWRIFYNEERPHSSLKNLTPMEFMKQYR